MMNKDNNSQLTTHKKTVLQNMLTPFVSRKLSVVSPSRGFASLPVVLLLGGIIIELAITGAFVFYYVNSNVYGNRLANQATTIARSAIDDAIMRVILNPNCGNDINCPSPYTLSAGTITADVTITKNLDNTTEVVALGKALTKRHRIVAILNVSSTAPLITVQSITDAPL